MGAHLKYLVHQLMTTQCQVFVYKFSISSVTISHNDRIPISQQNMVVGLLVSVNLHTLMADTSEVNDAGVSFPAVYLSSE